MQPIKSKDPSTRTILVVDDDRVAASFFETILYKDGFEVMVEHDGESALNLLRSDAYHKFDLVILDLMMPRYGGYEVLKELQQGEYQSVPIFIVTARALDDGAIEMIRSESNVHTFWKKPVNPAEFRRKVHVVLGTEPPPRG